MFFTDPDWDKWGQLAEFLREKSPPKLDNKTVKNISHSEAWRYHGATFTIGRGAGRQFLQQVDLTSKTKRFDIGGGSGAYCIEACKKYSKLTATVLDLPEVVQVAAEVIQPFRSHINIRSRLQF